MTGLFIFLSYKNVIFHKVFSHKHAPTAADAVIYEKREEILKLDSTVVYIDQTHTQPNIRNSIGIHLHLLHASRGFQNIPILSIYPVLCIRKNLIFNKKFQFTLYFATGSFEKKNFTLYISPF